MIDPARTDADHLRQLSIGYYVMAGLTAFFGLLPLMHVGMGLALVTGKMPSSTPPGAPFGPEMLGWLFVVLGAVFVAFAQTIAVLNFVVGRSLVRRQRRLLCLVVAGLNCMNAPLGTLLGVFTFIVLGRDSVRALFESGSAAT